MSLFRGENPNMGKDAMVSDVRIPQYEVLTLGPFSATTLTNNTVFVSNEAVEVVAVQEQHDHIGGAGAVVDLEKLTGTQAPGAGVVIGSASLDLTNIAANTVKAYTLKTDGSQKLAAGDRLAIKEAGTLTGLTGCVLTLYLKRSS